MNANSNDLAGRAPVTGTERALAGKPGVAVPSYDAAIALSQPP